MNEREKAKAKRRYLIVTAAIECFVKNGIHQTGIRDIAKQANVSLGNLYNHFSGKEELIAEIALLDGQGLEWFAKELDTSVSPDIAMRNFVNDYLDYVSQTENAFLTIDILAEALRNPTVAEQFESNRSRLSLALFSTIERGILEGVMRKEICIEETVGLLLDAIEGLGLRSGLAGKKASKNARKTLQDMTFRMLST